MIFPLQVADGRFAARCALPGKPDQEVLGVVDAGATATCVDMRTRKRSLYRDGMLANCTIATFRVAEQRGDNTMSSTPWTP